PFEVYGLFLANEPEGYLNRRRVPRGCGTHADLPEGAQRPTLLTLFVVFLQQACLQSFNQGGEVVWEGNASPLAHEREGKATRLLEKVPLPARADDITGLGQHHQAPHGGFRQIDALVAHCGTRLGQRHGRIEPVDDQYSPSTQSPWRHA